jgi:DNA-binding NarL/FixJ family response regulator
MIAGARGSSFTPAASPTAPSAVIPSIDESHGPTDDVADTTEPIVTTGPQTADVLIVDDHGLLAQSLAYALRAGGLQVGRCAELTTEAIVEAVESTRPDVVLLDLDLGGEVGSSVSIVPTLTDTGTRVVMMTGVTDRARLAACVEAGAVGIIPKSDPFERLVDGVQKVVEAGTLLTEHERQELLAELRRHREADRERLRDFEQLTPREAQVLAALMDGLSAEQIASRQFVSLATVRSQIRSLRLKLDVGSQLSAVALARKAGWRLEATERLVD